MTSQQGQLCTACGATNAPVARFCMTCGRVLSTPPPGVAPLNPTEPAIFVPPAARRRSPAQLVITVASVVTLLIGLGLLAAAFSYVDVIAQLAASPVFGKSLSASTVTPTLPPVATATATPLVAMARPTDPPPTITPTSPPTATSLPTPEPTSPPPPTSVPQPTAIPTPPPAPTMTPVPRLVVEDGGPARSVREYYALISARQYRGAWNLLSPARRAAWSYDGWVRGFANTRSVETPNVRTVSQTSSAAVVEMTIAAVDADGPRTIAKRFAGTWTLVHAEGSWKLDVPTISELR